VDEIGAGRRCLVFTYTDENELNLRKKIVARHGGIPMGVKVMTYFTFLHTFCFRPIVGFTMRTRGLGFSDLPDRDRFNQTQDGYYLDSSGRLFHSRLAKLLITRSLVGEVCDRIECFFDMVFVDEVQDFAGNDFNFLMALAQVPVDMLLVGDFRQHTYDTSRDHAVNATLHANFNAYVRRFRDAGFEVDLESLSYSRRCSKAVCDFISERLGIPIQSQSARVASVIDVDSEEQADGLWRRPDVVKLFFREHWKYGCWSQNWGASKGEDHYDEVCVVLNPNTMMQHKKGELANLAPGTLNKLYVALSRSRGDIYLAPQSFFEKYKGR
jgi:hypothetical protein